MLDIARKAGLGPADLARLLSVSRATASMWLNGHRQPHHLLRTRVATVMGRVSRAVKAGDLPLSGRVTGAERAKRIAAVLRKHRLPTT